MIGVGEGGVISTNKLNIFSKLKLIASRNSPFRSKKDPYWKKYYVLGEGYNYLMPHLLGSIARAQVERFNNEILTKSYCLHSIIVEDIIGSLLVKLLH